MWQSKIKFRYYFFFFQIDFLKMFIGISLIPGIPFFPQLGHHICPTSGFHEYCFRHIGQVLYIGFIVILVAPCICFYFSYPIRFNVSWYKFSYPSVFISTPYLLLKSTTIMTYISWACCKLPFFISFTLGTI